MVPAARREILDSCRHAKLMIWTTTIGVVMLLNNGGDTKPRKEWSPTVFGLK
jgi:hypothetical protein